MNPSQPFLIGTSQGLINLSQVQRIFPGPDPNQITISFLSDFLRLEGQEAQRFLSQLSATIPVVCWIDCPTQWQQAEEEY